MTIQAVGTLFLSKLAASMYVIRDINTEDQYVIPINNDDGQYSTL